MAEKKKRRPRKEPKALVYNTKELSKIDFSDLTADLALTLQNYGFYGEEATKAWTRSRNARILRESLGGAFYLVSKDDVLDSGKPPSDKYIEFELTQDTEWATAQKDYSEKKGIAESLQHLVSTLEYKLESLRTLLANERVDKVNHLRD